MKFGEIKRIVFDESNQTLPPPPITAPLISPFTINLSNGGTTNLAAVTLTAERPVGVLLNAVVNWSSTFTPPGTTATLVVPGFANVTFEILRNGVVIYRVTQTAIQNSFFTQPAGTTTSLTTYQIATLLHFDTTSVVPQFCNERAPKINVYTLRATNILLVAPQVSAGTAVTTAAVGAVTFIAEKIKACRTASPVCTRVGDRNTMLCR
ncbi:MAG: hypothetical protein K0Q77_2066 [Anaerosporomusa subterranea]|nr:hypothetical protein [Anaerosporomusa subterranea]